jgi:tetratricopeptide (TPR) repeat protein
MKIYVTGLIISLFILLSGCSTVSQQTKQNSALNFYVQGITNEINGNIKGANDFYSKALKLNPDNSYLYEKLGRIALEEKKYNPAVKDFKKSIQLGAKNSDNYLRLGIAYYALGNYKNAAKNLETGLKNNENSNYKIILADIYIKTGRYKKAEKYYTILLKKFPDNPLILYNYALILGKEKKYKKAETIYKKIINSDPYFVDAYINLSLLYERRNQPDKAKDYCLKLISLNPQNSVGYSLLSFIYLTQNNISAAENILTKAVKAGIKNPEIVQTLGFLYFQQKKYKSAQKEYLKLIKLPLPVKKLSEDFFYLGVISDKLGETNNMKIYMNQSIKYDKNNDMALNYLGYSYLIENKHIKKALKLIKQAVKIQPDNGAYLDSLGWAYYKEKDYVKTKTYLLKAIKLYKDPDIMVHIGYLYYRLKDYKQAINWWEKSIRLKNNPKVNEMLQKAKIKLEK